MENAELRYYQSNLGSCISDSGVINQNVLESDCPDLNTWVVNGQTIEDCIKVHQDNNDNNAWARH